VTLLVALLLGVVQGVFMFVPVSSTSHLVLTQTWLRASGQPLPPPDSPELILFDLVVHVGTLVSIVVVMGAGLRALGAEVRTELASGVVRGGGLRGSVDTEPAAPATRLVLLGLLSVAVTGVLGLIFQDLLGEVFASPQLVAVALIATGAMLWWTDAMTPERSRRRLRFAWRGPGQVTIGVAVAIGVAQAVALAPGVSRSGTTIFVALLVGMRRTLAARYSFYIAIPTILAATGVQALQVVLDGEPASIGAAALLVGFVVAAAVGTVSLWAVLRLLEAARFRVFSVYVWALATVVLVTGYGA
jgi:undecaprenyl-diphosphatase